MTSHALAAKQPESEHLLRMANRVARVGGWIITLPERELRWSTEVATIHGMTPEEAVTVDDVISRYRPETQPMIREVLEQCVVHGTPFDVKAELQHQPGRARWVRAIGEAVRDAAGRITQLQGAVQDITEQQLMEAELAHTADRLATTLESISDAFFTLDSAFRFTYTNHEADRLLQHPRDALLGRVVWEAFPDAVPTPFYEEYNRALKDRVATEFEAYYPPFDRWFLVKAYPVPDGLAVYFRDSTERRRLEQQILRTQRLESIGTLAGGIAHDLNNVLSPILMSVEMMRRHNVDPDNARRLDVIAQAASRGASMIQQVLGFARGIEGQRHGLAVSPLIDETLRIVSETFPRNIGVHSAVLPGTSTILGDPTQLQQVLLNLCVNARDAMPEGGRLSVRAADSTLDAASAAHTAGAKAGSYVVITVEDSGTGIAPEHVEKIFDPFFTTKPVGEGTGLGLSTTLAIVKSHDGFLRVHSVPGDGTRVEVYLPAYLTSSVLATRDADVEAPQGHGETVLVVDDEPAIRETTRQVLEAHGYRVLEATDGADAIAVCARHSQQTQVAIIDLMMPVMDGVAAIQILQRLAPQVRVVAVSGLAASRDVRQAMSNGASEFLAKPYTATALLHVVARVLGRETTVRADSPERADARSAGIAATATPPS